MEVFIRVDASIEIGTGHVMRCLTLANELTRKEAKVYFICRQLSRNLCKYIQKKGFNVFSLPAPQKGKRLEVDPYVTHSHWLGVNWRTDAKQTKKILVNQKVVDWLIIDHYAIDKKWEEEFRPYVKKIMVIDDLADRAHDCDILLDQNLYVNMESRYEGLLPESCIKLLGPKYALLRPEFQKVRKQLKTRDGKVRRILIFFGGTDPSNETMKALEAIKLLNRNDIIVDIVVGSPNPNKEQVKQIAYQMPNVYYYCQIDNIAELMAQADLAIGAGGSTTWERCFLGLPTITIITAFNQVEVITAAETKGIVINLGKAIEIQSKDIAIKLEELIREPSIIKKLSKHSLETMSEISNCTISKYILEENEYGQSW
ncbi:UDP-2,4-diacetamido-2,4,6-trideoxy-beta-L-altropyranose hydrolase [Alkalihalobacterium alkalinitrilicum]|uniref:UDP-2,4-diacetamido-2,4, 6-trideoxy-beta-L-altropyranose hydrolase n=1 Tax=Alkalihalobacterium alkalinitrilicum TaxID=427920 RepID=UPI0015D5EBBB|nr:UDP-2,4-diacetamido-2,4,6-trideoxy-beta-L-altropyranose hydrolase [Alkalihalobacterium alkalinitrilicum]